MIGSSGHSKGVTLLVPEKDLEWMLLQWLDKQGGTPEFREPKCWSCGRVMRNKMWHVFFRSAQREAHLCRDCGKPYEVRLVAQIVDGEFHWKTRPNGTLRKKMRELLGKLGL